MKYIFLLFFLMLPVVCFSQIGIDDPATIEASIATHKRTGSAVLGRQVIEFNNKLLMDEVRTSSGEYRKISDILDKYEKAFNLVDGIIGALASGVQIGIDLYDCGTRLADILSLLREFESQCQKRGVNVYQAMAVYEVANVAGEEVYEGCKVVYQNVAGFVQPLINKSMTTEQAFEGVTKLGDSVSTVRKKLDRLYRDLYFLIAMRRTYWKSDMDRFILRHTEVYGAEALERWHQAMRNNMMKINSQSLKDNMVHE